MSQRRWAKMVLLLPVLLLPACSWQRVKTGWEFPAKNVDKIRDGETTRARIEEWFGAPFKLLRHGDGGEVWTYSLTRTEARGVIVPFLHLVFGGKLEQAELVVTFDERGIVVGHVYSVTGRQAERQGPADPVP